MKRSIFTPSMRFLIIALIILAIIVPKEHSNLYLGVMVSTWLLYTISRYLWIHKNKWLGKIPKFCIVEDIDNSDEDIPVQESLELETSISETSTEKKECSINPNFFSEKEIELILIHISLRITEKLKSGYKDATWEWTTAASLHSILSETTIRISVANMGQYTHADITFDRIGRITVIPMIIGDFASSDKSNSENDDEHSPEPKAVDVKAWYELVGQNALERVITELNVKGHSKLTIKDNGHILVFQNKKPSFIESLESFPPSNYWKELVKLLEEDELNAKISNNSIHISWN